MTKVEQRKWETVLQENLFWHELLVNMLQHREYFKVTPLYFLCHLLHEAPGLANVPLQSLISSAEVGAMYPLAEKVASVPAGLLLIGHLRLCLASGQEI